MEELVDQLFRAPPAREVVTAMVRIPRQDAQWAPLPAWVRPELAAALRGQGITRLYRHQAAAAESVRQGKHIVITTPTASGKTICYNLPVLQSVLENPDTRALYLFPTKALAQDQLAELHSLNQLLGEGFGVFTYDGDTPSDGRAAIRQQGHLVVSNPDMLHTAILPHHTKWTRLFENIRYVVLDELHTYRGVFGSHLANVLRRFRRVARFYGREPQFICSSATIANPAELAAKLLETEVEVIEESGAPSGEKLFVFYNPPVVNRFLGIRRSFIKEAARIAGVFLRHQHKTIVFANSRLHTEILLRTLREAGDQHPARPETIRGYRGGYLPLERREIERGLRAGAIHGVVATNALELGIDIGSLDVSILAGYPGTVSATWQRSGRAGRRLGNSCSFLVASSRPLDQFIVRHPEFFFDGTPESAFIHPDNLEILLNHLKAAAFELPLSEGETFGGLDLVDLCESLAEAGFLHRSGNYWHWTHEAYPANTISLRAATSDNFVIIDTEGKPEVIGEVDFPSALTTLHPKAIYLHEGQPYQVEQLDFHQGKAFVRKVRVDYFTQAIRYTQIKVLDTASEKGRTWARESSSFRKTKCTLRPTGSPCAPRSWIRSLSPLHRSRTACSHCSMRSRPWPHCS
jgi:DEAD/DEAH box helicase domain-containing protein